MVLALRISTDLERIDLHEMQAIEAVDGLHGLNPPRPKKQLHAVLEVLGIQCSHVIRLDGPAHLSEEIAHYLQRQEGGGITINLSRAEERLTGNVLEPSSKIE